MARIPLPSISASADAGAHKFPIQISLQTQEFLQGTLFHTAFRDIAAGEFVGFTTGVAKVESILAERGLVPGTFEQAWAILHKYQMFFEGGVFQEALVAMTSHWDWYVRRLSEFIRFARNHVGGPTLSKEELRQLERADFLPIAEQLQIISTAANIDLNLSSAEADELAEMTLVRNLALHNRREVDHRYLRATKRIGFGERDLRIVEAGELQQWHALLVKVLNQSALECARRYHAVPSFEPSD